MNNWQQTYIKDKLWLDDKYLLKPYKSKALKTISATKKCKCCRKTLFSMEFADNKKFPDKKLPVCTGCIYKRNNSKAVQLLNKTGKKNFCKTCRKQKLIGKFKVDKRQYFDNTLQEFCIECVTNKIATFEK